MYSFVAVLNHRIHRHRNGRTDGMPTIDHGVFTQQHNLAVADAHGVASSVRSGGVQVFAAGIQLQPGGDFPGLPYLDFVTQYQPVQDVVE